jgi:hypothetical protein
MSRPDGTRQSVPFRLLLQSIASSNVQESDWIGSGVMSAETYERMLPVITLLLGAAIGWWVKRSESRRSEVLEAGDTLAQIPNYIWRQGGEDS